MFSVFWFLLEKIILFRVVFFFKCIWSMVRVYKLGIFICMRECFVGGISDLWVGVKYLLDFIEVCLGIVFECVLEYYCVVVGFGEE